MGKAAERRRAELRATASMILNSSVLSELVRGFSNIVVSAAQAGAQNPMMASGTWMFTSGVGRRLQMIDEETKDNIQMAAAVYLGATVATTGAQKIITAFTGAPPGPVQATSINYDVPEGGPVVRDPVEPFIIDVPQRKGVLEQFPPVLIGPGGSPPPIAAVPPSARPGVLRSVGGRVGRLAAGGATAGAAIGPGVVSSQLTTAERLLGQPGSQDPRASGAL